MRKWGSVVPVIAAYALSALVFEDLPAVGRVDVSPLLPVDIPTGGAVGPVGVALLMPSVALGVWVLLTVLSLVKGNPGSSFPLNADTGSASVERFAPSFATVSYSVTCLLALVHLALVASVLGWPTWSFQVIGAGVGIALMVAGNVMPRVRPNWIVGIRTRSTIADPSVWAHTHRMLGILWFVSGLAVVALSIVALRFALVFALAALIGSMVTAHRIGRERSDALPVWR